MAQAPEKGRRMRLLVAAGGTGGHLYPAIAVAERFRELAKGAEVIFVGTERGLESSIVPAAGFPLELVRAAPLREDWSRASFGESRGSFSASWIRSAS